MRITTTENGPLQVDGAAELELYDHDGTRVDVPARDTVYLCRCGASTTKPFCDGTHSKIGFAVGSAAVEAEGA